ncbi:MULTISPECIES: sulfatase-like hydrolase/transferase [unclassified Beijerinckia]|uniref:sulfatase family protein n=1 Tax=unclassified Beijerinckia TaxID=2638183 RepID=UPI000895AD40|nr:MULTISPECIES: sulfatase-like hydrolase/transferase [unclassified Beijerinckia]MDH7795828.1 arylsulfatase A-like enzyme [Beijerinckia sp. GAS462]SEC18121.1 Arylsulfatase A [Beijerinckia sp. 28-YEA-48]
MGAKRRPNFLLIMTDQHRADHLGCYGNPIVRTPAIDALARSGLRFDNFFVANPICMPNRASIMTGRMPSLTGVRHNGIALSRNHANFVELLRDSGYFTALIGKSHLQSFTGEPAVNRFKTEAGLNTPPEHLREARKDQRAGPAYEYENIAHWPATAMSRHQEGDFYGFQHFELVADHGDRATGDYRLWALEREPNFDNLVGPKNALPDQRISAPQAWRTAVPEELYSTRFIEERTTAAIERCAQDPSKPFFIQMSFPDPHHPFTPPGKYWDMYDPADMTLPASFGHGDLPPIARMREALAKGEDPRNRQSPFAVTASETRDILALTYGSISMIDDAIARVRAKLIELGLDQDTIVIFTSDHGDFMGDHGIMLKLLLHYRGLIHVPFIWSEAGLSSSVREDLGQSIDIAPTILRRAGIQPYNGVQGRNLLADPAQNSLVIEEDSQRPMLGFDRPQRVRTLVTQKWRMSVRDGEDWGELYDLENDPHEMQNLWDSASAAPRKAELFEELARRLIQLQDRSPLPTYLA